MTASTPAGGSASGWWAPVLSVVAGLAVLGGGTATWVLDETGREVGGVEVVDTAARSGAEIAPGLLVVGVTLLLAGLVLAIARGTARRVLGLAVLVVSIVGAVLAVVGAVRAAGLEGALQPAVWLPLAGTGVAAGAGLLAARHPGRRAGLPARYDAPGEVAGRSGTKDPPAGGRDLPPAGGRDLPPAGGRDPAGSDGRDPAGSGGWDSDEWDLATDPDEPGRP